MVGLSQKASMLARSCLDVILVDRMAPSLKKPAARCFYSFSPSLKTEVLLVIGSQSEVATTTGLRMRYSMLCACMRTRCAWGEGVWFSGLRGNNLT